MSLLLDRWEALCSMSSAARFADSLMRGAGQVIFQNNPVSGVLFTAALLWGAASADAVHVAIGGLSALVAATATARILRADEAEVRAGLYGYNGLLTGLALSYFLGSGIFVWTYALLAAVVTAIAMLGPLNAATTRRPPAHTYPFVLVTWLFLLASRSFSVSFGSYPGEYVPTPIDVSASNPFMTVDFIEGVFSSISQIFFKDDFVAALLLLAGLAANSLAAAAFAVAGAIVAVAAAHLFGVESDLITSGVQGFAPVLTAVALGTVFYRPGFGTAAFAVLGVVATVITQSALNVALGPMGLPALSAPFDLVALIFFISASHLRRDAAKPDDI